MRIFRSKAEAGATIAAAATLGLVGGTSWPLGIPGEWEWRRAAPAAALGLALLSIAIVGTCYLLFVRMGAERIDRSGPAGRAAWLAGLAVGGFAWLWTVQEAAPEAYQLSKAAWVLYYPGPSGYFTEARTDERPLAEFLADYERRMTEGDVLHIGTHPPGLIVFFRGLIALCRRYPALAGLVVASEPDSVAMSLDALTATAGGPSAVTDVDRAVLWLAMLVAQTLAALTVLPLYGLARRENSPRASWQAVSFWPAVPAVAVFLPKSDAAFPCFSALILWLWMTGADRQSFCRGALAGLSLWLAFTLSLAFLPIAFLAAVATLWTVWFSHEGDSGSARQARLRKLVRPLAGGALGFGIPCLALRVFAEINLLSVWRLNLGNHAGFYRQFARTYWKWLLVNPIEFAIAAGTPLVCVAVAAAFRQWRGQGAKACAPAGAFLITWGILWLSGKNMGEAARLWLFLTPCLIWIAAPLFEESGPAGPLPENPSALAGSRWLVVLTLALVVCAGIVLRVVGFHYG